MVQLKGFLPFAFMSTVSAHFLLKYPNTAGFDDDNEGVNPCGGFPVTYINASDFHVDGDSIALVSIHPTAVYLMRATLDQTAFGNYTNLLPTVQQNGLGAFCETGLTVNSSWAGQKGVIQIVQDATDGLLYQCAPVNFVSGVVTPPTVCTNATGVSAAYNTAAALSDVPAATAVAGSAESSSTAGTTTAASTVTTPAASSTSKAGAKATAYAVNGAFWAAAGVMGALVIGGP